MTWRAPTEDRENTVRTTRGANGKQGTFVPCSFLTNLIYIQLIIRQHPTALSSDGIRTRFQIQVQIQAIKEKIGVGQ